MSSNYDLYKLQIKCIDCKKRTTAKPWDHPDRKKRCLTCYETLCIIEDDELDPDVVEMLTKGP